MPKRISQLPDPISQPAESQIYGSYSSCRIPVQNAHTRRLPPFLNKKRKTKTLQERLEKIYDEILPLGL
jgi:hypothetical protein